MIVLECHSRGDKRFSAFYARVGEQCIEHVYQQAKCDEEGLPFARPKGKRPHYLRIADTSGTSRKYRCTSTLQHQFYTVLWQIYLEQFPDIFADACAHTHFRDVFDSSRGRAYTPAEANTLFQAKRFPDGCSQALSIAYLVSVKNVIRYDDMPPEHPLRLAKWTYTLRP